MEEVSASTLLEDQTTGVDEFDPERAYIIEDLTEMSFSAEASYQLDRTLPIRGSFF